MKQICAGENSIGNNFVLDKCFGGNCSRTLNIVSHRAW